VGAFSTNWWDANPFTGMPFGFTPTFCGTGTVSVTSWWLDGCHPDADPVPSSGTNIEFFVANVDILEAVNVSCTNQTVTFTLTNTCGDVTWEVIPSVTNGAQVVGGSIYTGTIYTNYMVIARSTVNTNCMDVASLLLQRAILTPVSTNVFVNSDDDNGNGTNDLRDALSLVVTNENDLVELQLDLVNNLIATQKVLFSVSPSPSSGHVRVWKSPQRGTNAPILDNGTSLLSTNWPATNLPVSVWVEGVSNSAAVNDMAFTLTPFPGCPVSTNITVLDVTSVVFQTNNSPLLLNTNLGGPGGGLAIFPDKPTPTSTLDYSSVRVVATVQPAISNVQVYFRSIDVDDPSSTNTPPLDDETVGHDNKATNNPSGNLAGGGDTITLRTSAGGVAWTNFNTTMQPGDNFRVVASLLADFSNNTNAVALQTNDHGAVVYRGNTNEIPSNNQTEMLTVWRRLHVEVDSMAAVTNNFVSGNITAISGNGTVATNLTLGTNLNTGLSPADASSNLTSSANLGWFENGTIMIGTNGPQTNVTGNGDTFVIKTSGFNIPARISLMFPDVLALAARQKSQFAN